jgi:hypothetical protein
MDRVCADAAILKLGLFQFEGGFLDGKVVVMTSATADEIRGHVALVE